MIQARLGSIKENAMNIRVVMLRNTLPELHKMALKESFYLNGWPREETTFVFDPLAPANGNEHLEILQRFRDAGETVVVGFDTRPFAG